MADGRWSRRLVIFAKEPAVGHVKSRLAQDLGWVVATGWYRNNLAHLLRAVGRDPRWQTFVALAPDMALRYPCEPLRSARVKLIPQGGGDLGARMGRILNGRFRGPVVIVGSDIPAIRSRHIWRAFRAFGAADIVFGPATDGGFWLVGTNGRKRYPKLFRGVRWSGNHALSDSLDNIPHAEKAFVDRLCDVDSAADL